MAAYLVLLLAVLSRILPYSFHVVGMNLTAVGGGLLFFGARRSRWQAIIAVIALMATDYYLTVCDYGYAFHVNAYVVTWVWYAAICLLGHEVLGAKATSFRVAGAAMASATSFFLVSNFVVWWASAMYPHSPAGLGECYFAAIPFYANDLLSTGLTVSALFGLPLLSKNILGNLRTSHEESVAI